jgi:hypothetical protein
LFALTLLVLGIWKRHPPTRYAGIGALIAVAIIALVASFLDQRFLTDDKSTPEL